MMLRSDVKRQIIWRQKRQIIWRQERQTTWRFLATVNEMAEMHKIMYTLDWINDTICHYKNSQVQNLKILK